MIRFAEVFPDEKILQTLCAKSILKKAGNKLITPPADLSTTVLPVLV
jgi:hypothetical protein